MEFLKKYWLWFLLVPIAGFFVYRYIAKKVELSEKMKGVRAARNDNHVQTEVEENAEQS